MKIGITSVLFILLPLRLVYGSCHVRTTRVALRGCHLDAVHEGLRDARRGEGRPRLGPGVHTELSLTDRAAGVTIPPPEGEGAIELGLQK